MGFWDRVKDAVSGEEVRPESAASQEDPPMPADPEPAPAEPEPVREAPPAQTDPEDRPGSEDDRRRSLSYTVRTGDTLSEIGQRFGVDPLEIARHNDLRSPDLIYPGQVLDLPHP